MYSFQGKDLRKSALEKPIGVEVEKVVYRDIDNINVPVHFKCIRF